MSGPVRADGDARIWTDSTGKHRTEAQFVDFKDGIVRLRKDDGKTISVPVERLSKADQEFVKSQLPAREASVAKKTDLADLGEKADQPASSNPSLKFLPKGYWLVGSFDCGAFLRLMEEQDENPSTAQAK